MSSNDYTERETQVLELYNKEGKTTRHIAEVLRMSLRDISIILKQHGVSHGISPLKNNNNTNNNNNNNKSNNEKSTQAYKLFSEGKTLVQVSIELELREKEASKFFSEFLSLRG